MFFRRQWNGMPRRETPSIFMAILISPSSHTDPNLFPAHESPATQRTFMDTRIDPKERCFLLGIFFLSFTLTMALLSFGYVYLQAFNTDRTGESNDEMEKSNKESALRSMIRVTVWLCGCSFRRTSRDTPWNSHVNRVDFPPPAGKGEKKRSFVLLQRMRLN
ncbi:hypothetical protein CEXT_408321 [Caerostris extrusa]|uniref:Uncharacterized protein n=1 Tax=Caerostris extrusa TaxID=172846 RepID=A0AAV4SBG9_CAEEX|nr:hypothetical protein CEXT_408321 [Caerostris extrusa]